MIAVQTLRGPMKQQTVGEYITDWRMSKGLSLQQIADKTGVSKQYVGSVEMDKYEHPKAFILKLKELMTKDEYKKLVEVSVRAHREGLE